MAFLCMYRVMRAALGHTRRGEHMGRAHHCTEGLQHVQQGDAIDEPVKRVHLLAHRSHGPFQDLQHIRLLRPLYVTSHFLADTLLHKGAT